MTGRTHQARVHLASINTPILGDSTYGNKTKTFLESYPSINSLVVRQLLHARRLTLPTPSSKILTCYSPWPDDFVAVLNELLKIEKNNQLSL
jgi:23S rRNA pseudouridine1911/1915/1917 synthase